MRTIGSFKVVLKFRKENKVKIVHQKSGIILGQSVIQAKSFFQRLRGFMFYAVPPADFDGLYFPNCKFMHNSFVRFDLDLVFVNKEFVVVKIVRHFKPWQFSGIYFHAAHAVEFPSGRVPESVINGDKLVLSNLDS